MGPLPGQPGQHIDKLSQLDLSLGFSSLGATGKDIEDKSAAIDDLNFKQGFEIAGLCWRKVFVKNNDLCIAFCNLFDEFFGLAATNQERGISVPAFLKHLHSNINTRCIRQKPEFVKVSCASPSEMPGSASPTSMPRSTACSFVISYNSIKHPDAFWSIVASSLGHQFMVS